jgi:hypothetical protein
LLEPVCILRERLCVVQYLGDLAQGHGDKPVRLAGAPNGTAAVSWPATSFIWCHSSMRPTGACARRFSGMAAGAAMPSALPTASTASPASEYARARQPAPDSSSASSTSPRALRLQQQRRGRGRAPARASRLQDQRPGAGIVRTGLRQGLRVPASLSAAGLSS